MDADALLLVGRVSKPHGVRGEMKVVPETDDASRLTDVPRFFVGTTAAAARAFVARGVRFQQVSKGTVVLLHLEGVDSPESVDALRNQGVYAHRDDLPSLADDEFYLGDLIGAQVVRHDGSALGAVADVMDLPSHPILVIKPTSFGEVLIPVIDAFVASVDVPGQRVGLTEEAEQFLGEGDAPV